MNWLFLKLSLYVDADYADKASDRRSFSDAVVMLGESVLSATSTTQHCTTLSTSEVECYNDSCGKERSV